MAIHDWSQAPAGIFHDFHHAWIEDLKRILNRSVLPDGYYALAEQITTRLRPDAIPDVITLKLPTNSTSNGNATETGHGVALATMPPQVQFRMKTEIDIYAEKAKAIAVRHSSTHEVVAMIELVSPGNKSSKIALRQFVEKAATMLRGGINLLIVDLFPPSPRDPQGIHRAIWDEFNESDWKLPEGTLLTLVSYLADLGPEAFVEPTAVGRKLADMPLFLAADEYVPTPLEATYQSAWEAVPKYWQDQIKSPPSPS